MDHAYGSVNSQALQQFRIRMSRDGGYATRWSARVSFTPDPGVLRDQVCKHKAIKLIACGKLTFNETVVLHRVGGTRGGTSGRARSALLQHRKVVVESTAGGVNSSLTGLLRTCTEIDNKKRVFTLWTTT